MGSASKIHPVCILSTVVGVILASASLEARAQVQLPECTAPRTGGQPFSFLQGGFFQQLFVTAQTAGTDIGFAPNGDLWWGKGPNFAFPSTPNLLGRFSSTSTAVVDSTPVHVEEAGSPFPADIGTGMTNGYNGNLYSNTVSGVVILDANTGATLAGPFGPKGNGLGIATDPQTGYLVYVGTDSTLYFVDPTLNTSGIFSTATRGKALDGIYFDPTGNFLFAAGDRFLVAGILQSGLGVVDIQGNIVQVIPNPGGVAGSFCVGADGVAFHIAPTFVVSNNRDGTMTRYDFPNSDFTQPPSVSTFASGGFRGDLTQVGPDNCLYVSQRRTRFIDSTVSSNASLVRVCPNFVPPPGVKPPSFVIGDLDATVGQQVTFWDADWAKENSLSGGAAPAAFKGFASTATSNCGGAWSTEPGNSSNPPDTVPPFIAVIASSSISKSSDTISGNIPKVVIVRTDPGYLSAPGHTGTGTVVGVVCGS